MYFIVSYVHPIRSSNTAVLSEPVNHSMKRKRSVSLENPFVEHRAKKWIGDDQRTKTINTGNIRQHKSLKYIYT